MHRDTTTGSLRAVLAHRPFRWLMLALATSQAGDWLYNVALLAFVYASTGSAAWLAATTVARVLPMVVLGPLGGVVADRFDRRRTMIVCDVVRAGLMVGLAVVAVLHLPVLLVPVLAASATAVSAPYPACTSASVPRLVPERDLPAANAVRAVVGPACVVAGPALGALLLLLGPAAVVFAANAGTFLLSAFAIARVPAGPAFRPSRRSADGSPRLSVRDDLATGAAALWSDGLVLRLVTCDLLCSFLYGVETVALVLVSSRLGGDGHGYGLLLACIGAGGVLGSTLAARLVRSRHLPRVVLLLMFGVAAPLGLLALSGSLVVVAALAVVMGMSSLIVEVCTETVLQRELDEAVFARAYGFAFPASIGGIAVGAGLTAPLIALLGLTGALLLLSATVCVFSAALFGLSSRTATAPGVPVAEGLLT